MFYSSGVVRLIILMCGSSIYAISYRSLRCHCGHPFPMLCSTLGPLLPMCMLVAPMARGSTTHSPFHRRLCARPTRLGRLSACANGSPLGQRPTHSNFHLAECFLSVNVKRDTLT